MNLQQDINFLCDLGNFLRDLGLSATIFGKDIRKIDEGCADCNLFLVVTRRDGDELYHPETLPEPDMNKLRNWIRCGDPTGFLPEWRDVNTSAFKLKVYLAGENLGIDCTSVMDDMFDEEDGKKYTYSICRRTKEIKKITHPQDYLSLS